MLKLKINKQRKEKNVASVIEGGNKLNFDIELNTIFYVVKYGNEINLKITNHDAYEQGMVLALGRTLELEGIRIDISQWADWTIGVTLYHNGEELKVAELLIPNENIDWNEEGNFVKNYSKIKWIEEGSWCKEIKYKIDSLKHEIDKKRKEQAQKMIEKKSIEEQNNLKKRLYFENIFKNKKE